jgi:nucleoside-diphosphate-sugar epimerase/dTDP-glucose pyrophosphorylase
VSERIVLRGPFGFIGSAFTRALGRARRPFTVLTRENRERLEPGPADLVIDCGGNSRKYLAESDPAFDRQANVTEVEETLRSLRPARYLLLSSSAVYSDPSSPETTREVDRPEGPVSVYGAHKREAEDRVRASCPGALILRPAGFFGPGLAKGPLYDLVEGEALRVSGDSRMQLLDVDAFAAAALALVAVGGTFNAVPSESTVLAEAFAEAVRTDRERHGDRRLPQLSFGLDGRRFARVLGPAATGREALDRFVDAYRRREAKCAVAVLLLAGGRGTRLKGPEPKAIRPVAGAPLVRRTAEPFARAGYRRLSLCLGHRADQVDRVLATDALLGRAARVVESTPLGTGGAVLHALERTPEETAIVVNGDTVFRGLDVEALVKRHVRMEAVATLVAAEVEDAGRFGRLRVADDGRLVAFAEKTAAGPGLVNAGCLVVDRARFLDAVGPVRPCSLERELLPALVDSGRVHAMRAPDLAFVDAGTPEGFREAEQWFSGES